MFRAGLCGLAAPSRRIWTVHLVIPPQPPTGTHPTPAFPAGCLADGDFSSIMGQASAMSCPNYPQMAHLLPRVFKPTELAAPGSLQAGQVYTFQLAPDWQSPTAAGGLHAVSLLGSTQRR